jgi:hypothetical protein
MDNFLEIRDELKQYRNCSEELELLKLQIEELEHRVTTINSTSIIGKPEEGGIKMYLNNYVAELADLKDEYDRRYALGLKKMLEVKDLIDTLPDPLEKRILFRYYCSEKKVSLFRISREFSYSPDHIKRKHGQALAHLKEIKNRG